MSKENTVAHLHARWQHLPKPHYPFPDFIHPGYQQQREEYYAMIDREYTFHSEAARTKHKQHHFTDLAARGLPFLNSLAELRPVANFTANGAMIDDYLDRCSLGEMEEIQQRITALLTGEDTREPVGNDIYRPWWALRQEALACDMPERHYRKFIASIHDMLVGYRDERPYNRPDTPPPFEVYTLIREQTAGGLPFCKYAAMQKTYRRLPDDVLEHPHILRLHTLCSRMIGIHNDIISLPKELGREGDVMNLVKVMQHEHKVPLEEAYTMALAVHDSYLKEFMLLHQQLPSFGGWQEMAYSYVRDLGVMVAGVYAWHTHDTTRYVPGGYVEGEFISRH
nr:hypothetical protein [uncultured Chitinophaga sp.]